MASEAVHAFGYNESLMLDALAAFACLHPNETQDDIPSFQVAERYSARFSQPKRLGELSERIRYIGSLLLSKNKKRQQHPLSDLTPPNLNSSLMEQWVAVLKQEGVASEKIEELIASLRTQIARENRPKWSDRLDHKELRTLTAPQFLRAVHANDIVDGTVDKDQIRAIDSALMGAVESYISQRQIRKAGLGDAEGLTFILSKPPTNKRGRPRQTLDPS